MNADEAIAESRATIEKEKECIAVIEAYKRGEKIQWALIFNGDWKDVTTDNIPEFGLLIKYRIKPSGSRKQRTIYGFYFGERFEISYISDVEWNVEQFAEFIGYGMLHEK